MEKYKIRFLAINRFISSGEKLDSYLELLEPNEMIINKTLETLDRISKRYKNLEPKMAIYFPVCLIKKRKFQKYVEPCGAGQSYCSVSGNGDVKFCSYSNYVLGNIFETPLERIWNTHKMLVRYRTLEWLPTKCRSCSDFDQCVGGCKVTNYKSVYSVDKLVTQKMK